MEEFRRHAPSCPLGRPPGVRRLDVAFDNGAFPVWARGTIPARGGHPGREVVGMVRPEGLGLSEETGAEVVYQWDRGDADPDCPHCGHRA
jgi:hypothetical protein